MNSRLKRKLSGVSSALPETVEGETDLDMGQAQALHQFYWNSPEVQAARELMYNFVFSNALDLEDSNGKAMKLTPKFHAHLQKSWIPFAKAVLDSFRIIGVAVVVFKRTEDGAIIPHVPDPDEYVLRQARKGAYERVFNVYPTQSSSHMHSSVVSGGSTRRDESAAVFVQQAPVTRGQFVSVLESVMPAYSWIRELRHLSLIAERRRCQPVMFTEVREGNRKPDETVAYDMYVDGDDMQSGMQSRFSRDALNMQCLQQQREVCMRLNELQKGVRSDGTKDVAAGPGSGAFSVSPPGCEGHSFFCVPQDQKLANQVMPDPRTDLLECENRVSEAICTALGVPSALLHSHASAGDHKFRQLVRLFNANVCTLARVVEDVLSEVYEIIYGDAERAAALVLEEVEEQRSRQKRPPDDAESTAQSDTDPRGDPAPAAKERNEKTGYGSGPVPQTTGRRTSSGAGNGSIASDRRDSTQHDVPHVVVRPTPMIMMDDLIKADALGVFLPQKRGELVMRTLGLGEREFAGDNFDQILSKTLDIEVTREKRLASVQKPTTADAKPKPSAGQ